MPLSVTAWNKHTKLKLLLSFDLQTKVPFFRIKPKYQMIPPPLSQVPYLNQVPRKHDIMFYYKKCGHWESWLPWKKKIVIFVLFESEGCHPKRSRVTHYEIELETMRNIFSCIYNWNMVFLVFEILGKLQLLVLLFEKYLRHFWQIHVTTFANTWQRAVDKGQLPKGSDWVTDCLTDKPRQWSDSGLIKNVNRFTFTHLLAP